MTAREIRAQLSEAIRSDRRAAAILKKIAAGRADLTDTMDYSLICGRLTGSQLAEVILELSEDREELAEALLHDRYEDINARCAEVQTALDDKQGLHLAPQKADFPAERAAKFAHSLLDPTVTDETIKRRARSVSENITVTFHDDFIRENAAFRDRAGLKCYVERTTSGGCCDWCSNVAGRYLMQEQPEGLFRRHDNCDCTIVYDGQVLRGQFGVNGRRGRKWVEEKPKAEYTPPRKLSRAEAEKFQGEKAPKRLTDGGNGGIIGLASNAHSRNRELEETIKRCINQEKPVFADDLAKYFNNIPPEKGKYIMALHGSAESGYIYGYKIDARTLANIVKSRKDYNGKDEIVLISCNTGSEDVKKCFAQELADAMGVRIHAPTHYGAISPWGSYYSSDKRGKRSGKFKHFDPKERDDDT